MKRLSVVGLAALCLAVILMGGTAEAGWKWTQIPYFTGDSITCVSDTLYGTPISVPASGWWVYIDLDSAGSAGTGGYDSILVKFQTRPNGSSSYVTSGAIAGLTTALSLGITDTDEFPVVKYFHSDTAANYVLTEIIRPMIYFAPTDQQADSTVESGTAGKPALSLKFYYGWYE